MGEQTESSFIAHEPCPNCHSRNNFARYSDGHGFCFGCDHYEHADGVASAGIKTKGKRVAAGLIDGGEAQSLGKRGISEETCAKFGYTVAEYSGKKAHVAPYYRDGVLVAQHLRLAGKDFKWVGDAAGVELFGQHLWRDGGKMVVVTEGEIDCMSVSQVQSNKWPVVSIPSGAKSAKKALTNNLEWLERYETVVLMFDMDEPGREAALECSALFSPGKCKVASLELKDANALLTAGRGSEIISAIWGAKAYRPDGIVRIADLRDELRKPVELGTPWPWPELTELTHGIRPDEIYTLGAGTGMGKSEVWKEVMIHLMVNHGLTVGGIFLEETPAHTVRCLAGKLKGKLFHIPSADWTTEEAEAAVNELADTDNVVLYDHWGHTEYEVIKSRIRHMVVAQGCKHIVLDHITALVSGDRDGDERKQLDFIMTDLGSLVRELHFTLFLISHLSTPDGASHEEGGRVMLKHFRGSRAIGQWSSYVFGLERNQQEDEEEARHTSTFRILKDRYTGQATGKLFNLKYIPATGRLVSAERPATGAGAAEDFGF